MTKPRITHQTKTPTRAEWLAERRHVIAGSDAGRILGVSKYGGPMDVYLEKLGHAELPSDEREWQTAGRYMEPSILNWYADRENVGIAFANPFEVIRSTEYSRVGATLDARRYNQHHREFGEPVDAKNLRFMDEEWGDEYTDQMPMYYAAQLILQMHVTGANFADLAVLFSGQDLRVFRLHRDDALMADVLQQCQHFYEYHVLGENPPAVDGSPSYSAYLQKMVRQTTEQTVTATPEMHAMAVALNSTIQQAETAATAMERAKTFMKDAIGEHWKLVGPNWHATWKQAKDSEKCDWEAVARQLSTQLQLVAELLRDEKRMALYTPDVREALALDLANGLQQAQQAFTETRPGSRRFLFTFNPEPIK